jgi:hypothetical protein
MPGGNMSDRPIAAILAAVAAAVFLAAFSAAAVLRPDTAAVADDTTNASPAAATQELKLATIAAPSLSRVAALPGLHLPAHRKPAKRKHTVVKSSPRISVAPQATPVPTATPAAPTYTPPARTYTPPRHKSSSSKTFDTSG